MFTIIVVRVQCHKSGYWNSFSFDKHIYKETHAGQDLASHDGTLAQFACQGGKEGEAEREGLMDGWMVDQGGPGPGGRSV